MDNHWNLAREIGDGPLPDTIVCPRDGAEMVLVPKGEFTMGLTEDDVLRVFLMDDRLAPIFLTEIPQRQVRLDAYYIDRYPVTNFQYRRFLDDTGHRKPALIDHPVWGNPLQPVVFIGWDDARAYARWAGKALASEEQWEKAGRGVDGRWWTWGSEFLEGRCNSKEYGLEQTSNVGLFDLGVSPYGCYDMCGNVWEMCEGEWLEEFPPMRGGCFLGTPSFVRVTCRWTPEDPVNGAHWLGFRCVKEVGRP